MLHAAKEAQKKLQNGNRLDVSDLLADDRSGAQDLKQPADEQQRFRMYDSAGRFYGIYGWDSQRKDFKSIKMFCN